MRKIIFVFALACFTLTSCKSQGKKEGTETNAVAETVKEASFKISGMTCEVGCAKTIASKLSKKEGVIDANVVFADSIATVKYDPSKIDKAGIASFINGMADGETYKAKASCKTKKACNKTKKECDSTKKASCDKKKKECTKTKAQCDSIKKASCDKKKKECNKTKTECDSIKKAECSKKKKECSKK